ncbi:MAG: STAS domain-containing protein [Candidatus Sumerlaeia bacterium]|nr:STAS domain-containing protein [Candidatus Sumerlaeia bacterium]
MKAPEASRSQTEPIQVGKAGEHLYVVRVEGRGSFQNCGGLKQFLDRQLATDPDLELIVDLENCTSMDSTFMGVIAGVGLRQRQSKRGKMVIVNLNEHTSKLLRTLGLTHFLDVRETGARRTAVMPGAFEPLPEAPPMSRMERIRMMIEAHERLIDADKGNEVKFQGVLTFLAESLGRAEQPGGDADL